MLDLDEIRKKELFIEGSLRGINITADFINVKDNHAVEITINEKKYNIKEKLSKIENTLFSTTDIDTWSRTAVKITIAPENVEEFLGQLKRGTKNTTLNFNSNPPAPTSAPILPPRKSEVPQISEEPERSVSTLKLSLDFETIQSKKAFAILMKQRFKTKENCMILTKPGSSDFYYSFKTKEDAKKITSGIADYQLLNREIKEVIQPGSETAFFKKYFFEISLTKEECNNLYSKLSSEMKIPQDLNLIDQERFIIFCDNFEQKKLNRQDSKAPKTEEFFKRAKVDPAKDHLLIMHILESTLGTIGKEFSKDSTVYITYRSWVNATRKDIVTHFVSSNKDSDAVDKMQKFVHRNDLVHFDAINECRELLKNPPTNTIRPS